MQNVGGCRESVDRLIDEKGTMPEVEELVSHFGLAEEEAAALWLYAHALGCKPCPHDRERPTRLQLIESP